MLLSVVPMLSQHALCSMHYLPPFPCTPSVTDGPAMVKTSSRSGHYSSWLACPHMDTYPIRRYDFAFAPSVLRPLIASSVRVAVSYVSLAAFLLLQLRQRPHVCFRLCPSHRPLQTSPPFQPSSPHFRVLRASRVRCLYRTPSSFELGAGVTKTFEIVELNTRFSISEASHVLTGTRFFILPGVGQTRPP